MKSFAVLAAAFAGAALAQELPMPTGECSLLCINNMAQIAESEFSCGTDDLDCFCTKSRWAYGVRDCSQEACDEQQAAAAINWAFARCAGVAATADTTLAAVPILTSAVDNISMQPTPTQTADDDDDDDDDDDLITSIVTSLASDAASVTSSLASEVEDVASSVTEVISSLVSSASQALDDAESSIESELADATDSALDDAEQTVITTTLPAFAPKITGMPMVAGAGVAAWLLL
ncbi:hypothetical protein BDW02DRAFT_201825 [Decorospora gaudefroyi]|uniref:CFEM domain-containing protein n=1 Tax=Decorospora gaudefroyi TaxID=184978 RepID=A0A6A5KN01_9PLEO|nr:hypothetical protein BDW02DRAFT_201825 [Decorospora gaudefroyi]